MSDPTDLRDALAAALAPDVVPAEGASPDAAADWAPQAYVAGFAATELEVAGRMLRQVERDRAAIRSGAVLTGPGLFPPAKKLQMLDEIQERAWAKVVVVRPEEGDGEPVYYRIGQANWTPNDPGLRLVSRLAPVAQMLVPARLGDELELPRLGYRYSR